MLLHFEDFGTLPETYVSTISEMKLKRYNFSGAYSDDDGRTITEAPDPYTKEIAAVGKTNLL